METDATQADDGARPFDLTLSQAVMVAEAIDRAKAVLEASIMDSTDDATTTALQAVHGELRGHQRALRTLIEAAAPATVDESDERGAFLIFQALAAGEPFDAIAVIAADVFRHQCALRGVVPR